MKLRRTLLAGVVLALTLGAGTASAAPIKSSVTIAGADCDGRTVDLITNGGPVAWDLAGQRVFVLMGASRDGVWLFPIVPGQATHDLAQCRYTNFGHDDVIYGIWAPDR
jgi:hypothetical protein